MTSLFRAWEEVMELWNWNTGNKQQCYSIKKKTVRVFMYLSSFIGSISCWCSLSRPQNKDHNHSISKVESLGYDRLLIYKKPSQDLLLCVFLFRGLFWEWFHGNILLESHGGGSIWRPLNICHWVWQLKQKIYFFRAPRHWTARTVQLAKI